MRELLRSSRWSPLLSAQYILAALAILFAPLLGKAIAEGRIRTVALLLVPMPVLLVGQLSQRARYSLITLSILLVPLQMPRLPVPYGFSLSELVLLVLTIAQILMPQSPGMQSHRTTSKFAVYVPFLVLASAGLGSALRNGELPQWHVVCLVPLLLLFLVGTAVRVPDDALRLVHAAVGAILGFLLIYWLTNQVGSVVEVYGPEMQWRIGAQAGKLGPVQYVSYSITLGTLVALAVPFVVLQLFHRRKRVAYWLAYGGILALFGAILLLTSARGATIGAMIGAGLALTCSGRFRSSRTIVMLVVLAIASVVLGPSLALGNPSVQESVARWTATRWTALGEEGNLQDRIETMRLTFDITGRNLLGYGYGFLWRVYGIDEAIIYSALLNGAGVGGFLSFVIIVGALLWTFVPCAFCGIPGPRRDVAAMGLGTLVCGLIAGVTSESVLLGPLQSFVFWTILVAAYWGTRCQHQILRSMQFEEPQEFS